MVLNCTVQNMARPREFDRDEAIAQAMEVFWACGYEQSSLDALCEATELNRSSLYNAFGSKADLFAEALDHYASGPASTVTQPLLQERGVLAIKGMLDSLCEFVNSAAGERGCLFVNSARELLDDRTNERVAAHFDGIRCGIERAYRQAIRDGDVAHTHKPGVVADWLLSFVRGILTSAACDVDSRSLCQSIRLTEELIGLR